MRQEILHGKIQALAGVAMACILVQQIHQTDNGLVSK